jgi:hypothetical protein
MIPRMRHLVHKLTKVRQGINAEGVESIGTINPELCV